MGKTEAVVAISASHAGAEGAAQKLIIVAVFALGYVAVAIISVIDGAALGGGVGAIAAAFYGPDIPQNRVLRDETAITADCFLVMAHDTPSRIALAKGILQTADASQVDVHAGDRAAASPAAAYVAA